MAMLAGKLRAKLGSKAISMLGSFLFEDINSFTVTSCQNKYDIKINRAQQT
jgi:hypothetical protein